MNRHEETERLHEIINNLLLRSSVLEADLTEKAAKLERLVEKVEKLAKLVENAWRCGYAEGFHEANTEVQRYTEKDLDYRWRWSDTYDALAAILEVKP